MFIFVTVGIFGVDELQYDSRNIVLTGIAGFANPFGYVSFYVCILMNIFSGASNILQD